jgi:hypothetical protein
MLPPPTPAKQANSSFLVDQEVGLVGADAELYFLRPLLTRVVYQHTAAFSANKLTALKSLYAAYQPKGFEMVSTSTDQTQYVPLW